MKTNILLSIKSLSVFLRIKSTLHEDQYTFINQISLSISYNKKTLQTKFLENLETNILKLLICLR